MSDGGAGVVPVLARRHAILRLTADVNEGGGESAKTLEVAQAVLRQLLEKAIQIGHTIFKNRETVAVHLRLPVEIKHRASADHGIQRHQLAFIRAGKLRPALAAVFFPERGDRLVAHRLLLAKVKRGVTRYPCSNPNACRSRTASVQSQRPKNR